MTQETTPSPFVYRHIGLNDKDITAMLKTIGASSLDQLMDEAMPSDIRTQTPLAIGEGLSEENALAELERIAKKNKPLKSFIGQGYHGTILPAVIKRNILENPAWYTAYTPYQPEISQGRLEALLNFQTLIAELTGLDVSNASLLDESTAAAEAMALAERIASDKPKSFFVDAGVHPQTLAVLKTRAEPLGWNIVVGHAERDLKPMEVFGALIQYPDTRGEVRDPTTIVSALKAEGAIAVIAADPLALTLLKPPGELGADIAVGSMQRFGVPMGFGGPHAAYMAVKDSYKRLMPGRLVGVSVDARGKQALRLTLQTREQHIRREKATSNICTAQVLLAVISAMYAVYHGPEGLRQIALDIASKTKALADALRSDNREVVTESFFDTIVLSVGDGEDDLHRQAERQGYLLRKLSAGHIGISVDETTSWDDVQALLDLFGCKAKVSRHSNANGINDSQLRRSGLLTHPVFHNYRSETEMLRYIRRLSDRDLALDRTMIPLGSCTMKLNATSEMIPVTWREFSDIHPFAPRHTADGYHEVVKTLSNWLAEMSGYDAVSMQPNSGAQGELAGLLAIRAYHQANGQGHRNICLIPSSAHGTNPASAQMAGMDVIVVSCDSKGNIDVNDLKRKAEQYTQNLAAIMITYPSTHGVFEEEVRKICTITHQHGGQVYLDGANLNAQVGLAKPGHYGADVSHFNLHKTFCIPHGGGGPGVGPIGVKAHLAPYLPGHPHLSADYAVGPVSGAPFGSAGILPISYMYCLMMGGEGLTLATKIAILSANYLACRLERDYPVLYKNAKGRVAHECIIDPRAHKDKYGVSVDDIAKRLIDYGFHAPTMSFPVAGTLMIEPTESEAKVELDRFVDAMLSIRREIADVENGTLKAEESPLRFAPHSLTDIVQEKWDRKYSRAAALVLQHDQHLSDKYLSPVNRIDNVYGDRNIMCVCPPLGSYQEAAE
jgi:glycine dehydrogenase